MSPAASAVPSASLGCNSASWMLVSRRLLIWSMSSPAWLPLPRSTISMSSRRSASSRASATTWPRPCLRPRLPLYSTFTLDRVTAGATWIWSVSTHSGMTSMGTVMPMVRNWSFISDDRTATRSVRLRIVRSAARMSRAIWPPPTMPSFSARPDWMSCTTATQTPPRRRAATPDATDRLALAPPVAVGGKDVVMRIVRQAAHHRGRPTVGGQPFGDVGAEGRRADQLRPVIAGDEQNPGKIAHGSGAGARTAALGLEERIAVGVLAVLLGNHARHHHAGDVALGVDDLLQGLEHRFLPRVAPAHDEHDLLDQPAQRQHVGRHQGGRRIENDELV